MEICIHYYFMMSLLFSFIFFLVGPSINGNIYFGIIDSNVDSINIYDCGRYTDLISDEKDELRKNFFKKERSKCRRHKAMNGLEHTIFSLFFILGVIFGIINLSKGAIGESRQNEIKHQITYITIISIIIEFIITLIYLVYSFYIFENDSPSFIDFNNLIEMTSEIQEKKNIPLTEIKYAYPVNGIIKTDKNGAFAKFNTETNKYELLFPPKEKEKIYDSYAKYKELNKKQYNFNKELYVKKIMIYFLSIVNIMIFNRFYTEIYKKKFLLMLMVLILNVIIYIIIIMEKVYIIVIYILYGLLHCLFQFLFF